MRKALFTLTLIAFVGFVVAGCESVTSSMEEAETQQALPLVGEAPAPAAMTSGFFQGFETDNSGWDVFGGAFDANRVASGTNGVPSADGSWHAESQTAATNWGGYNSTFPTNGYVTSADVYLDVDAGFGNDTRFDYTSAINRPDGTHRRDFVFNAGYYDDLTGPGAGTNRFVISASNNAFRANSFPKNPGRDPIAISTTGWYTFQHTFYDDGSGVLAVDLSIINASGITIKTWTLSDPTDVIGTTVGGNRYGWFAANEFSFLAIDNTSKHDVPVVPATKDECKNGGWQNLARPDGSPFKNQGDCIQYVNTGK